MSYEQRKRVKTNEKWRKKPIEKIEKPRIEFFYPNKELSFSDKLETLSNRNLEKYSKWAKNNYFKENHVSFSIVFKLPGDRYDLLFNKKTNFKFGGELDKAIGTPFRNSSLIDIFLHSVSELRTNDELIRKLLDPLRVNKTLTINNNMIHSENLKLIGKYINIVDYPRNKEIFHFIILIYISFDEFIVFNKIVEGFMNYYCQHIGLKLTDEGIYEIIKHNFFN